MKRFFLFAMLLVSHGVMAVKPNSLFSDGMVLQQGVPLTVWGTADDRELVTVDFNGQRVTTVARDGRWRVRLAPMDYLLAPSTMLVMGKDTVAVRNVLVGEVWLCSGQSNMERQLGPRGGQPLIDRWEQDRDSAHYPQIREYYVPPCFADAPKSDAQGAWRVCSPQTVSDFSAVGYFFARNLHKHLQVPVGIVFSAFGGTIVEDWMSAEASMAEPQLADFMERYDSIVNSAWHPEGEVKNGLYNAMVSPLVPYALKGVVWYQGESNNMRPESYQAGLTALVADWRSDFGERLPFLIVQIAPHRDMPPSLREAQRRVVQSVEHTALVVLTDVGMADEIHPPYKQPVGERLSYAARALAYGERVEYGGPMYRSHKVKGSEVILRFSHVGRGLVAKSGALRGFTVAGADGRFVPAQARIKGKTVIVGSSAVRCPVAVRYGWENVPDVNLYNADGFPASPFRTDE